eukprot:3935004-Rhodomonas_salina.1
MSWATYHAERGRMFNALRRYIGTNDTMLELAYQVALRWLHMLRGKVFTGGEPARPGGGDVVQHPEDAGSEPGLYPTVYGPSSGDGDSEDGNAEDGDAEHNYEHNTTEATRRLQLSVGDTQRQLEELQTKWRDCPHDTDHYWDIDALYTKTNNIFQLNRDLYVFCYHNRYQDRSIEAQQLVLDMEDEREKIEYILNEIGEIHMNLGNQKRRELFDKDTQKVYEIGGIIASIPIGDIPSTEERKQIDKLEQEIDKIREQYVSFCGYGSEFELTSTQWRAHKEQDRMNEYHTIQQWVQETRRQRENNEILMLQMWRHDE